MYEKKSDIDRCRLIVKKEIKVRELRILEKLVDVISDEILNISYSKGGDYSDSTLSAFASVYFDNALYKKYL